MRPLQALGRRAFGDTALPPWQGTDSLSSRPRVPGDLVESGRSPGLLLGPVTALRLFKSSKEEGTWEREGWGEGDWSWGAREASKESEGPRRPPLILPRGAPNAGSPSSAHRPQPSSAARNSSELQGFFRWGAQWAMPGAFWKSLEDTMVCIHVPEIPITKPGKNEGRPFEGRSRGNPGLAEVPVRVQGHPREERARLTFPEPWLRVGDLQTLGLQSPQMSQGSLYGLKTRYTSPKVLLLSFIPAELLEVRSGFGKSNFKGSFLMIQIRIYFFRGGVGGGGRVKRSLSQKRLRGFLT